MDGGVNAGLAVAKLLGNAKVDNKGNEGLVVEAH